MDAGKGSYYVAVNGKQQGPYDEKTIRDFISNGWVQRDTLIWKDGMAEWTKISTLPLFDSLFVSTPPPLHQQPIQQAEKETASQIKAKEYPDDCPLVKSVREAVTNHYHLWENESDKSITTSILKNELERIGIASFPNTSYSIGMAFFFRSQEKIDKIKEMPEFKDRKIKKSLTIIDDLEDNVDYLTDLIMRILIKVYDKPLNAPIEWESKVDKSKGCLFNVMIAVISTLSTIGFMQ